MYNAGTNRVRAGGTPKKTLDYIANILASQEKIDELYAAHQTTSLAAIPEIEAAAESGEERPHLVLLSPIRGRP
jgi:ABC-type sugar transport system substrate-binding protein